MELERGKGTTGTLWIGSMQRVINSDPKSKARSVVVTEAGVKLSRDLFAKHFGKRV